ncbi:MAG: ABC transporter ATP-binding protein [Planctomycetota bacterium]
MAKNSGPVIETRQLTKVYSGFMRPDVLAVDRLDLTVGRGEVFGLLGPNGSGKTTTTKLLLGLIFPTGGSATVLGKPAGDIAVKARIGFLPEESYLYRFLNAEETLDFYGRIFGLDRAVRKRRIDELIELVGLQDARKRALRGYSKGMSRRIGLAQALINDPELIFLDEPTSGLDPIGRLEVKELISRLKELGKTVMLCTHLLPDVQDVCDRIAILHNGRLVQQGSLDELLMMKNRTQLTVDDLTESEEKKLTALLAEMGHDSPELIHPYDTLSSLFLRIIESERDRQRAEERREEHVAER